MNLRLCYDREQEIRLLVSVRRALMWMASHRVPLVTGQDPIKAWLEMDSKIQEMKEDGDK